MPHFSRSFRQYFHESYYEGHLEEIRRAARFDGEAA